MHKSFSCQNTTELLGSASVFPAEPVVAGSTGTWTFTYRAGRYGLEDSGAVRLAWRMVSDWEIPQTTDPQGYAYLTVHTTAEGCEFQVQYERFIRPYTNSILIRLLRGSIREGDEISIVWGDTSQGGPGARAQSYQERDHEFMLLVDSTGSGVFRLVDHPIKVDVISGEVHSLQAVIPGTVEPGVPFAVTVRALDSLGNPAAGYQGTVRLTIPEWQTEHTISECQTEYRIPEMVAFGKDAGGVVRIENCVVNREGVFHIAVEEIAEEPLAPETTHTEITVKGYTAVSNPSVSAKRAGKLFWADMHGQNADTLGSGSMDEYYTFSRDVAAIDATGWQGNDFEITDAVWEHVKERTAAYNEEGRFLTFLGYEWSGCTPRGGDYNIFYRNDEEPFYPSSDWLSEGEIDSAKVRTPISELWEQLKGRTDVLAIPHVGGRCGNLAYVNESITPAVEVHSHHGTFDWFALEAMQRRLKVGFVGSSDDHTCRVGMFLPCAGKTPSGGFDVASGFTGIWADSLTKESVWQALKARHCYASTFTRIYAEAELGDAMMGDEIALSEAAEYHVYAAGARPVERVQVFNWDHMVEDIPMQKADANRVLVRWKGVIPGGKHKSTRWDGSLHVVGTGIKSAEEYGFDREDQGICENSSEQISWISSSSGDYDGAVLELEDLSAAELRFNCIQGSCVVRGECITEHPYVVQLNANCSVEFVLAAARADDEEEYWKRCKADVRVPVIPEKETVAWWAKIILDNGDAAWISPVFVKRDL